MSNVFDLHPKLGEPKVIKADVPGGYVINIAGVIQMARDGDTPQCRSLVRFYSAEYRALDGQPLGDAAREWAAFQAAWARMVRKFGVAPLGQERPL